MTAGSDSTHFSPTQKTMLKQYLKDKGINQEHFARKIGINMESLRYIFDKKSPNTRVVTCLKIKELTGLNPSKYLKGLENIKSIIK